jgi:hypothetical protein
MSYPGAAVTCDLTNFENPEPIAPDTAFSGVITSDMPSSLVHQVQHARLDSRQAENALLSTIAFAGEQ